MNDRLATTTRRILAIAVGALLVATGCTTESTPDEIVLLTHDSFALSEGTLEQFTEDTGVEVVVRTAGDAGSLVNRAILTKDNPIGDVLYGIDNTFLSRAVSEGIFVPYRAEGLDTVPDALVPPAEGLTPIDYGDVCLNYDIAALEDLGVRPPTTLADLTQPDYRGLVAVQDPATSSPGLAFLLRTIEAFPEGSSYDWRQYWADLFANEVTVTSDWSEAYYTEFTRAGGTRPIVVSYASSPPAEVLFGDLDEAPTAVVEQSCFRQIEYAGILAGTDYTETAGLLVDFLLGLTVQEDIPLNMFVYPANGEAALPEVFVEYTTFPAEPVTMEPERIEANRDEWIQEWTQIARS